MFSGEKAVFLCCWLEFAVTQTNAVKSVGDRVIFICREVSARFQNVQKVLFAAKYDKECRNCRVKNYAALLKNNDDSKLP